MHEQEPQFTDRDDFRRWLLSLDDEELDAAVLRRQRQDPDVAAALGHALADPGSLFPDDAEDAEDQAGLAYAAAAIRADQVATARAFGNPPRVVVNGRDRRSRWIVVELNWSGSREQLLVPIRAGSLDDQAHGSVRLRDDHLPAVRCVRASDELDPGTEPGIVRASVAAAEPWTRATWEAVVDALPPALQEVVLDARG